ncbi:MAG TPA: PP2C family protein-serine/threonine phosphatase, partial [Bacteroidota bacterium]
QNTGGDKFVTFFWGILDAARSTLAYVNAGHNYPYLLHADGSVERLAVGGMILGIMAEGARYEQAEISLRPGDILLLFTDGVSEAMSRDSEEFGEERLERILRGHAELGAQEIIAAVHEHILEFTAGASQSDDITMMVLKVSG